jgi:hypothetical protein
MALGITCVPLLTMSLAQLDWTHCVVVPVRRKAIAAAPPPKPAQWQRADARTPSLPRLSSVLDDRICGVGERLQFGLMSTERPASRISPRLGSNPQFGPVAGTSD